MTRKWRELSPTQRTLIIGGAVVQLTLLALAQRDLSTRSPEEIRGRVWMWRIVTLVNLAGPIAYFLFGVRRGSARPTPGDEGIEAAA